mgnify:FL=1
MHKKNVAVGALIAARGGADDKSAARHWVVLLWYGEGVRPRFVRFGLFEQGDRLHYKDVAKRG